MSALFDIAPAPTPDQDFASRFGAGLQIPRRENPAIDLTALPFRCTATQSFPSVDALAGWNGFALMPWFTEPFRHALAERVLFPPIADTLLDSLESIDTWKLNDGGFYRAYECALDGMELRPGCGAMLSGDGIRELIRAAEALFREPLSLHGPVAAHRMIEGNGIGIHTDMPHLGEETHRIVLLLARERDLVGGGHFVLLKGTDAAEARRVLPLAHNSAVAFRMGPQSPHAVTRVWAGVRFSVIFSFRNRTIRQEPVRELSAALGPRWTPKTGQ